MWGGWPLIPKESPFKSIVAAHFASQGLRPAPLCPGFLGQNTNLLRITDEPPISSNPVKPWPNSGFRIGRRDRPFGGHLPGEDGGPGVLVVGHPRVDLQPFGFFLLPCQKSKFGFLRTTLPNVNVDGICLGTHPQRGVVFLVGSHYPAKRVKF